MRGHRTGIVFALALACASPASALQLVLAPEPADVPLPSDAFTVSIELRMEEGDAVTGAFATIDSMGASFVSGTEQAFHFVNGVLLTPIGAPGNDIGPILGNPDRIGGWEAQTLQSSGAPGPAIVTLGTATYHRDTADAVWLTLDTSVGEPGGTIIGLPGFVEAQVIPGRYVNYHLPALVPEPAPAILLAIALVWMAAKRRR